MKKIFATIIISIISIVGMTLNVFANTYVCGDTNNDGFVDVSDSVIIQRYLLGDSSEYGIPYMPWNKAIRESGEPVEWVFDEVCGDVNSDGEVTIADAVIIERYVARTIEALPYLGDLNIEIEEDVVNSETPVEYAE